MKSRMLLFPFFLLYVTKSFAHHQIYPGILTRPILSDNEASKYVPLNYFGGWTPEEIITPNEPDYIVNPGESIQAVVNMAIKSGSPSYRSFIYIKPGIYQETVYVQGNIPLTLYSDPLATTSIIAALEATTTTTTYKKTVNPNGERYQEGDSAWSMYNDCANQVNAIGTFCTAVLWVKSDNFQLNGITVYNGAVKTQALAVRTSGDKIHLMNSNFLGVQDTLGMGIGDDEITDVQRVFVHMCYIEGQIDYVFGGASVVLDMVTLNTTSVRDTKSAYIFAPDTPPDRSYGFLAVNCTITGVDSWMGLNKVKLARAWDHKIKTVEEYVPGESPNGQLVIRDSKITNVIDVHAPYGAAATSSRPFKTDINKDRDLNDPFYNRLWEFNNRGSGA